MNAEALATVKRDLVQAIQQHELHGRPIGAHGVRMLRHILTMLEHWL